MHVIGQFRDLDEPDHFVWLRGFRDMESRDRGLRAFYGGPVWERYKDAANATMIDSDNVFLLRPAGGSVNFEWLPSGGFLIERWEVPIPDVPNGVAVIGAAPEEGRFLQYQFDSRGVARIYTMEFDGDTWRLWRSEPDLSPLDFHQRFTGSFSPEGPTIRGRWESSQDGSDWQEDFGLLYRRLEA
jgi:hypothetical protein